MLQKYLLPLTSEVNQDVISRAFDAVSQYPVEILEEVFSNPADLIDPSKSSLLTRLITHESTSMGKALFKGLQTHARYHDKDDFDKLIHLKSDTIQMVKMEWLNGRLVASKKSGLAMVSLLAPVSDTTAGLFSDKSLRQAIKDISMDSEYQSFDAVAFWVDVWRKTLLDRYEAMEGPSHTAKVVVLSDKIEEAVQQIIHNDLKKSSLPNQTANMLYSITGLVLCGVRLGLPTSHDQCLSLARDLYEECQHPTPVLVIEDHLLNDEIQRAIILSMGSLVEVLQPHHSALILGVSQFILFEAQTSEYAIYALYFF